MLITLYMSSFFFFFFARINLVLIHFKKCKSNELQSIIGVTDMKKEINLALASMIDRLLFVVVKKIKKQQSMLKSNKLKKSSLLLLPQSTKKKDIITFCLPLRTTESQPFK